MVGDVLPKEGEENKESSNAKETEKTTQKEESPRLKFVFKQASSTSDLHEPLVDRGFHLGLIVSTRLNPMH